MSDLPDHDPIVDLPLSRRPASIDPMGQPAKNARIVVTGYVYHQPATEQPFSVNLGFSRQLESDEQPWIRKIKIGEEWQPLDPGWVKEVALLVLVNDEGEHRFQRVPTEQEKQDMKDRIVELGYLSPAQAKPNWLIPPGENFRGMPVDLASLRVRCRRGEARCVLYLFSK